MRSMEIYVGATGNAVRSRLEEWKRENILERLWKRDPSVWSLGPVPELEDRLGWLDLPHSMEEIIFDLESFASRISDAGIRHVVLLGMGGSSLAPEAFARTFGGFPGMPSLRVLDSTHPVAVSRVAEECRPEETLYLVSSKSGTTVETRSLMEYFWDRAAGVLRNPGDHFAAVTDPGTPLESEARNRNFIRVFNSPADVGGRFSALSVFGLLPAALIGVDLAAVGERALKAADRSSAERNPVAAPAAQLGAFLGETALAGMDKLTLFTEGSLPGLAEWIEQLVAESTGKDGRGILPVVERRPSALAEYSEDRVFVHICAGEKPRWADPFFSALEKWKRPYVRIDLSLLEDIGGQFFLWEAAVALAASAIGVHPFNQPDVQSAKDLAKKAVAGELNIDSVECVSPDEVVSPSVIAGKVRGMGAGSYVALMAFLPMNGNSIGMMENLACAVRRSTGAAVTYGFGPRFLHSTGQYHKGGPARGIFIQIVGGFSSEDDVRVPGKDYTFGELITAQADGDFLALKERGREIFRIDGGEWDLGSIVETAGGCEDR